MLLADISSSQNEGHLSVSALIRYFYNSIFFSDLSGIFLVSVLTYIGIPYIERRIMNTQVKQRFYHGII